MLNPFVSLKDICKNYKKKVDLRLITSECRTQKEYVAEKLEEIASSADVDTSLKCANFLKSRINQPEVTTAADALLSSIHVNGNPDKTLDILNRYNSGDLHMFSAAIDHYGKKNIEQFDDVLDFFERHKDYGYLGGTTFVVTKLVRKPKLLDSYIAFVDEHPFANGSIHYTLSDVIEYIDKFSTSDEGFEVHSTLDHMIKFIDKYAEHPGMEDMCEAIRPVALSSKNAEMVHDCLKIIEKYMRNYVKEVCEAITEIRTWDFKELMLDRNYNLISNSKNPKSLAKKILNNDYSKYRFKIRDYEVKQNISYSELDLIKDTHAFVLEVHKDRAIELKRTVSWEFYGEMNRAIDQGYNLVEKRRNLKQYCFEVMQKMRDKMEELMVVNNA